MCGIPAFSILPGMKFITDEKQIFLALGQSIAYPLRLFNLDGLGLDQKKFLDFLQPTHENLPWDYYDVKREQIAFLSKVYPHASNRLSEYLIDYYRDTLGLDGLKDLIDDLSPKDKMLFHDIVPYRKRGAARFRVAFGDSGVQITRLPLGAFSQKTSEDDVRALERVFAELPEGVANDPQFLRLIETLALLVGEVRSEVKSLDVTAHQVRIVARDRHAGDNAPEGIHQDGADYIVSAIVINKQNITGGISTVYGPDKKTSYLHVSLAPGQGIFQADSGSPLWHDVTPIELDPESSNREGFRDMIGFDMKILP